jgi:hypothetical protein
MYTGTASRPSAPPLGSDRKEPVSAAALLASATRATDPLRETLEADKQAEGQTEGSDSSMLDWTLRATHEVVGEKEPMADGAQGEGL